MLLACHKAVCHIMLLMGAPVCELSQIWQEAGCAIRCDNTGINVDVAMTMVTTSMINCHRLHDLLK